MKNFIVCIDDFKVPDGQDWGYDGRDEVFDNSELSLEYFKIVLSQSVFFPDYDLNHETGGKRGSIFIASKGICTEILSSQSNLKKYN